MAKVEDPEGDLPEAARIGPMLINILRSLEERIKQLDTAIAPRAQEYENVRRLATIPGVTATALVALSVGSRSQCRGAGRQLRMASRGGDAPAFFRGTGCFPECDPDQRVEQVCSL